MQLDNFEKSVEEFREKVIPKIFKADLLPGYTRATLTQIEKHIVRISKKEVSENITTLLFAYGVIYAQTLSKTIKGARWDYKSISLETLRVRLPIKDNNGDSISVLPIKRVIELYKTKDLKLKGLVKQYDEISNVNTLQKSKK
ncbi:hypothetical protein [Virgibacillus salexigens]|uniref:Uncharacterized protein n=1 Tax=Virgibacillus massiliensis TaxID=1462526 RepID=A0A024QI62_9BACI|nr:hypothetical protein [Virgibacillus massiliensis]CDQ41917.1 hypothetical protein BN990_04296 [Virgibacillus massiliensis]